MHSVGQGGNHRYYGSLDGLRAVCIILTLINHTPHNPGINGSVGVDIFFALSGYLITMLLIREYQKNSDVCLICFYVRRAFRIVPLYAFTISLYLAGAIIAYLGSGDLLGFRDWRAAAPWLVTFSSEWRPTYAGTLMGHAWTLGIEEKFYLGWPLIFTVLVIKRRRWPLALIALSPLLILLDTENLRGYAGIFFGSAVAFGVELNGKLKSLITRTSPHIWAAMMLAGYILATKFSMKLNILVSLPSAFFISALINRGSNPYQRMLALGPLASVGGLTYGIYLIHPLVQHITNWLLWHLGISSFLMLFATMYIGSIVCALALQKTLELPLVRVGRSYARALEQQDSKNKSGLAQ